MKKKCSYSLPSDFIFFFFPHAHTNKNSFWKLPLLKVFKIQFNSISLFFRCSTNAHLYTNNMKTRGREMIGEEVKV